MSYCFRTLIPNFLFEILLLTLGRASENGLKMGKQVQVFFQPVPGGDALYSLISLEANNEETLQINVFTLTRSKTNLAILGDTKKVKQIKISNFTVFSAIFFLK